MAPDTDGAAAAWIAILAGCCSSEAGALADETVLVAAGLGDDPVVVAVGMPDDTELALSPSGVCVFAVGELDAATTAESYAPATGLAEEVDIDEDVAGAPNALAVGMSARVREAADTPNS